MNVMGRSQWKCGLRCRSATARLLRLWVRISPGTWISVSYECCVLSGRGLCDELITRKEKSYHRPWCVVVCDLEISWMRTPWPNWGGGGVFGPKKKLGWSPPLFCGKLKKSEPHGGFCAKKKKIWCDSHALLWETVNIQAAAGDLLPYAIFFILFSDQWNLCSLAVYSCTEQYTNINLIIPLIHHSTHCF